jgi:hypothetical protein
LARSLSFYFMARHFRQWIAAQHDLIAEKQDEQPYGGAKQVKKRAETLPARLSRIVKNRLGHADKANTILSDSRGDVS